MPKNKWPDWDVYLRDRCTCQYCGLCAIGDFNLWRQLSIDHVVRKDAGGSESPDNKVVCCRRCNELLNTTDASGATLLQRVNFKRRIIAEQMPRDFADYHEMMLEFLSGAEGSHQ